MTATTQRNDLTVTARIEQKDDEIVVRGVWTRHSARLDRTDGSGWIVKDMKIASRLAAAINAGVVFPDPKVATDVNGKSYVNADATVLGRVLNADLKRLGF